MFGSNRQPWGWPPSPAMGEQGGFMPQRGPMMGGGHGMGVPSQPGYSPLPGGETPMPKMPGMPPTQMQQPGIMPMGWRLDQLRQRMASLPAGQWQEREPFMQSRLGRLWQWAP